MLAPQSEVLQKHGLPEVRPGSAVDRQGYSWFIAERRELMLLAPGCIASRRMRYTPLNMFFGPVDDFSNYEGLEEA
eukprot:8278576-Lingulodinium_polyedra.AAC.1